MARHRSIFMFFAVVGTLTLTGGMLLALEPEPLGPGGVANAPLIAADAHPAQTPSSRPP